MSKWSYLANSKHIDRVLNSVKHHGKEWSAALADANSFTGSKILNVEYSNELHSLLVELLNPMHFAAFHAAREAAWHAARCSTNGQHLKNAYVAARYAIVALIISDDSHKLLEMSTEKMKTWVILCDSPIALLLLPASIAFNNLNEMGSDNG